MWYYPKLNTNGIYGKSTLVQVMTWHQAITWTHVGADLCRHMASKWNKILIELQLNIGYFFYQ